MKRSLVLIAHNLRSCHNVGSLLRTAEGFAVEKVYLTGYTPYPKQTEDARLPHISENVHKQICKTSLGAEKLLSVKYISNIYTVINELRTAGYTITALEQVNAQSILTWEMPEKIALILGRETEGIESDILKLCEITIEIPMLGKKESFNVVQAAAMALFHCKFSK